MPTLLVVDDEPSVLRFVAGAMSRHGWTVEQASTVDEALDFARRQPVDVALCDVVMPRRGGPEFVSGIRELSNGVVPVVLMSGAAVATKPAGGPCWGTRPVLLQKPFTIRELAATLERALPSYE